MPLKYLFGNVLLVKKRTFSELFISMCLGDRKSPHLQIRFDRTVSTVTLNVCFKHQISVFLALPTLCCRIFALMFQFLTV